MKHTEYIVPIGEEAKEFDEIFIGVLRKNKELIRCKDCKYWKKSELIGGDMICDYTYFHKYHRNADDFCSKAERKE